MKLLSSLVPAATVLLAGLLSTHGLRKKASQHRRAQFSSLPPFPYAANPVSAPTIQFTISGFNTAPAFNPQTDEPTASPTQEVSAEQTDAYTHESTIASSLSTTETILPTTSAPTDPTENVAPAPQTASNPDLMTRMPSLLPTDAPTDSPSLSDWSVYPSDDPTQAPSITEQSSSSSPSSGLTHPPLFPSDVDIVEQVQNMTIQFPITFSLWSPNGIPKAGSEFELISEAVLTSIRVLYCEDPVASLCTIKDDLLLANKETFVQARVAKHTTMAMFGIVKVVAVEEENFDYTAWEVSIEMLQLGIQYVQEMIEQLEESHSRSIEELQILIRQMIKQKVTLDVEKSIRGGTFDGLLHAELGDDKFVSAVKGQEFAIFSHLVPHNPATNQGSEGSSIVHVESGPDMALIALYVAIGAVIIIFAACVLVFYYYYSTTRPPLNSRAEKGSKAAVKEEDSTFNADGAVPEVQENMHPPAITTPSVSTDSDDLSSAVASWKRKPARFVLEEPKPQGQAVPDQQDDWTDFPTAGSIVAGSAMGSVESSLDGWSVHGADVQWS